MHPHGAVADSLASTRAVLAAGLLRPCIPEAWSEGPQTASSFSGSSNSVGSTKARLARSVTESAQRTTRLRAGRGPTRTPARLGFSEARSTATTWVCPLPARYAGARLGVQERIDGPFVRSPRKSPFCRGKVAGGPGSAPFGAAMDSSASYRSKYCHNGGMPLRSPLRAASREGGAGQKGPRSPSRSPSRSPTRCRFAGEQPRVRGSVSFGGSHGLACLFAGLAREVLPQRGPGLRPPSWRRLAWGPRRRSWPLPAAPLKTVGLQGKSFGGPGSAPFGGSDGVVCLPHRKEVLPQRGMTFAR
jgi:hypothetical protein